MRVVVWILLTSIVSVALSKSNFERNWSTSNKFEGLFRQVHQWNDNCRELSETFGAMIQHSAMLADMFLNMGSRMTGDDYRQILVMVFGFDIVDETEARAQYTCEITQSQTLSELKQALEDNNLLHNMFRLVYDAISMIVRLAKRGPEIPPLVSFLNALESAGLTELDSDRVQLLAELADVAPYLMTNDTSAAPYPGSNSAKCRRLTGAFIDFIVELSREIRKELNRSVPLVFIEQLTGLDIVDPSAMGDLFCDLVDGASSGIQGLYNALDDHEVVAHLMGAGYSYAQIYIPAGRKQLEKIYDDYMSLPPPPYNGGNQQHQGAVNSQTNPRIAPHSGPTRYNRGTGSSGTDHPSGPHAHELEMQAQVIRLTIEFLREVEASNLLQLAIDI